MKQALLALVVAGGLTASPAAQAAKPNFTGTWTLDIAKSNFGPAPPPESMVMVVEHKDPAIRIKTTQKSADGETLNDRSMTIDGKPNTNKITLVGGEQQTITSTSKWDGAKFVTTYPITIQGGTITFVDTWSLDGAVLNIKRDFTTPDGTFTITTVFNKK
jgi:hypothetical protein